MCSLCGVLGGNEHWADAVARPGVFTRNVERIDRRRERANRVRVANRVLSGFGMTLSDWQGASFVLSTRTGKRYRLPKASELTQAGAGLAKACAGNVLDADFRREFGGRGGAECSDGHASTAPTGGFAAEKAGLYDTGGNVREWTSDCDAGNCRERQAIGASWFSDIDDKPVRAFVADAAFNTIGLRVAREID